MRTPLHHLIPAAVFMPVLLSGVTLSGANLAHAIDGVLEAWSSCQPGCTVENDI